LHQLDAINQAINQKFKVNSAEKTKKTKNREKKEKTDMSSV